MPLDYNLIAAFTLQLISLASKLRSRLQQSGEWTEEQEAKYRAESAELFKQDHWKREGAAAPDAEAAPIVDSFTGNRPLSDLVQIATSGEPIPEGLSEDDVEVIEQLRGTAAALTK